MSKLVKYFLILITVPVLLSCYREPIIPDEPYLEFRDLRFVQSDQDTLFLTFYFEDGDGDFGLLRDETFSPFHPFDYIVDAEDSLVTISSSSPPPYRLVTPGTGESKFFSEVDNRKPYNCDDYAIISFESNQVEDTFYIQKNEFHFNLHITFYRKINGVFTEIGFDDIINECTDPLDARVPVFDTENINKERPVRGTVTYPMNTVGFPFLLGNDPFKIEFYIYDFKLNKSNVVETPEFTLLGIRQ